MKTLLRRIFGASKDDRGETEAPAELEQAIRHFLAETRPHASA